MSDLDPEAALRGCLLDCANAIKSGAVSAVDVTRAALDRIAARDDDIGAFLTVASDQALSRAQAIDDKRTRGEPLGALAGVPLGIKDALCTDDMPTTAGSRILTRCVKGDSVKGDSAKGDSAKGDPLKADRRTGNRVVGGYVPPYDATAVARLRAADAVLVGKCNMDEFAMGSSTENSAFRPAKNPWDLSRTPGGSSGGSAAAVAARMAAGALGSDTGGSVRQPAGLTGTVGIKPSYGRVSRYGLIAFASSLDQVGVLANSVRGAALLLETIAGHDPHDSTSVTAPVPGFVGACDRDIRGLTVGVPSEYFAEGLDDEVRERVEQAIDELAKAGARIAAIELPHTRHAVATYYVLATAECSSNLARYDGVRYGLRIESDGDLESMYRATRSAGFGLEVKRRIMLGTYVLSAGYYDAYYTRAQKVRTLIRRDFERAFESVDLIATPVSPTVAFELGSRIDDPLSMYLADVYTLPSSLAGLAAISVPAGQGSRSRLPVGLQLIAPPLCEERMLSAAACVEAHVESAAAPP